MSVDGGAWDRAHHQEKLERNRRYRRRLKLEGIVAYGGKCKDCPCRDPDRLEFDHEDNNGNRHRAEIFGYGHASPGGWNFILWLKKHGWPQDIGIVLRCDACHTRNRHPNRAPREERHGSPAMQYPDEACNEQHPTDDPVPF